MSEQIQVREGVWLTRDGEHVEVRARDMTGNESSEWRWLGRRKNLLATWRNDGTLNASREQSNGDLVQFLRSLPEPETTADTLAEIEGQTCVALQEALGQALERAHIDDMRRVIDALTAERDRLQREHQTITEHARELLESAQQARDERDLLAQRLWTKPSEDSLQKQVGKQQIEINTLQDKLQDVTSDRDRLQACVRDLEIEIDAIGQQPAPADKSEQIERIWDESRERAVSEIIELLVPLQVATGTHAESVLQILPAVIRRWMDGGPDDVE